MRDRGCLNAFKIINFNAGRIVLLITGIAPPNISLFSSNGNCTQEVTWYKVLGVDGAGQRNNKLRQVQGSSIKIRALRSYPVCLLGHFLFSYDVGHCEG